MVQSSTYTACVFLHNVIMLSTLGNYSLWPVASGQTVFCLRCDSRISTNLLPSETEVHSYHTSWQTQHLICLLSLLRTFTLSRHKKHLLADEQTSILRLGWLSSKVKTMPSGDIWADHLCEPHPQDDASGASSLRALSWPPMPTEPNFLPSCYDHFWSSGTI